MTLMSAIWTIARITLCHAFGHLPDRYRDDGPIDDSTYHLIVLECPRCGGVSKIVAMSPEAARRLLEEGNP